MGLAGKQPVLLARKTPEGSWLLYRNQGSGGLDRKQLRKLGQLYFLEDVLCLFQGHDLRPFCLKSEVDPQSLASRSSQERREYFRKQVHLSGEYTNCRSSSSGQLQVEDLSLRGLKFSSIGASDIRKGDTLTLSFVLDDQASSRIKRKARVQHKDGNSFGVEFINPPDTDKDLGFYLF